MPLKIKDKDPMIKNSNSYKFIENQEKFLDDLSKETITIK